MSIHLQVELKEGYAEAYCHGIYSTEAFLDVVGKALSIGQDTGVNAVLIDTRDVNLSGASPGTMERYRIGEMTAKMQLAHRKLVALAVVGKEPFIDPERFAETVAVNRGARGKVFENMEDAIRWIEDKSPGKSATGGPGTP